MTRSPCYSLSYIFCLLCELRKMEAIIRQCHWRLDGLLMGVEQLQEAVHTPGAHSKQAVWYSLSRAFRCQTQPCLGWVITGGAIRGALDAGYQWHQSSSVAQWKSYLKRLWIQRRKTSDLSGQRCSHFTAKLGPLKAKLKEKKSKLSAAVVTDAGWVMLLLQPSSQSQNIK